MSTINAGLQPGALEIHCLHLPRMLTWYRQVLVGEIIYRDAMQTWLYMPSGWHLALLDTQYPRRAREVSGPAGLSLQVQDVAELMAHYQRLKTAGIYPEAARKNGLCTWLQYRDPDGGLLRLCYVRLGADVPGKVSSVLGDDFDPELLFAPARVHLVATENNRNKK